MRRANISRKTKETEIELTLNLDEATEPKIFTGIGFFDHVLTAMAFHGGFDLSLSAKGDLEVDCHHTVEDIGIVLGEALFSALGDKKGIARYGDAFVPMDEALVQASLDISGRGYLVWNVPLEPGMVGGFATEMAEEFFRAAAVHAGITLHINLQYGKNKHHILEAVFKAVGQSLRQAFSVTGERVPSTKGCL